MTDVALTSVQANCGRFSKRVETVSGIAASLGAAAVLVSSEPILAWLGLPDGSVYLIGAGSVHVFSRIPEDESSGRAEHLANVTRALDAAGIAPGDSFAVEHAAVPPWFRDVLVGRPLRDASERLAAACARKSAEEIECIERAAHLVAIGQAALREAAHPGVSEEELSAAAHDALSAAAGHVETQVDLMSGPRTELVGTGPSDRRLATGEPVLFDLALSCRGFWSDSCSTFACGEASVTLRSRHAVVERALERGISAIRPGLSCSTLDQVIRAPLVEKGFDCPHHTGHGIGFSAHEYPWIQSDVDTRLEEQMVIALEPGVYSDGVGVRLEHVVVVEADGARVLSTHSTAL